MGGVIMGEKFFGAIMGGVGFEDQFCHPTGWVNLWWGDIASLTESVSRVSSTPKVRVENKCAAASDAQ